MKKFIALVLSCFIVMQMLPLVVHAAEEGNKEEQDKIEKKLLELNSSYFGFLDLSSMLA